MSRPRVMLADDHKLLLEAFHALLEPDYEVVGTASDGRELLKRAPVLAPDIVVLDISMPLLNGMDAGRQLKKTLPDVKLIFVTVNTEPEYVHEAFAVGATGYVLKSSAASELFQALREAVEGRNYVSPAVSRVLMGSFTRDPTNHREAKLTERQREVLQLLAEGFSMKQAAAVLDITPRTVAFHKYRMMEALGIETSAELVQHAVKLGIVKPK